MSCPARKRTVILCVYVPSFCVAALDPEGKGALKYCQEFSIILAIHTNLVHIPAEFAALDPEGKGVVPLPVMRERLQGEPFSLSSQEVRSVKCLIGVGTH